MGSVGQAVVLGNRYPGAESRVAVYRTTSAQNITSSLTDAIFNAEAFNVGGWTVNLTTGEVTVPAGVSHVNVEAQCRITSQSTTQGILFELLVNDATVENVVGYGLGIAAGSQESGQSIAIAGYTPRAPFLPVSPGDILKMQMQTNTGTAQLLQNFSWLYVEKAA